MSRKYSKRKAEILHQLGDGDFIREMRFKECLNDAINKVYRNATQKISQDGPENAVDALNTLNVVKQWINLDNNCVKD